MAFQTTLPIFSFFSLTSITEKAIIVMNTAKAFTRAGYRTILIDLDFEVPLVLETLRNADKWNETSITSNEWIINQKLDLSEVIDKTCQIEIDSSSPKLSISPCGRSVKDIQKWQTMDDKEISKSFRRLSKLFRLIKKEQLYDIVLLNLPNNFARASFPIINSSFCFAITDHDTVSNSLLSVNLDAITGIHP